MKSSEVPTSSQSKSTRQSKSRSETRVQLLKAAIEIIVTQGIEKLTLVSAKLIEI